MTAMAATTASAHQSMRGRCGSGIRKRIGCMATEFLYTKGGAPAMVEPGLVKQFLAPWAVIGLASSVSGACVPPGNSTPYDAGAAPSQPTATAAFHASEGVMREPFEDNFDRKPSTSPTPSTSPSTSASATSSEGGP